METPTDIPCPCMTAINQTVYLHFWNGYGLTLIQLHTCPLCQRKLEPKENVEVEE